MSLKKLTAVNQPLLLLIGLVNLQIGAAQTQRTNESSKVLSIIKIVPEKRFVKIQFDINKNGSILNLKEFVERVQQTAVNHAPSLSSPVMVYEFVKRKKKLSHFFRLSGPPPKSFIKLTLVKAGLKLSKVTQLNQTECVESHNRVRIFYGAKPLKYSAKLRISAQAWAIYLAKTCKMFHSPNLKIGENIYRNAQTNEDFEFACDDAVRSWITEDDDYYNPNLSGRPVGHYTQTVWKATTEVGCAEAYNTCGLYVVCHYLKAGNIKGQYVNNVPKLYRRAITLYKG